MGLRKLKILLTAAGCPGGVTMIQALKNNGERQVEIVGTDMRPDAAGRFFVDRFYTVPAGSATEFIPRVLEIAEQEKPDLILPQSSYEILSLARHRTEFEAVGVPVMVADPEPVEHGGNKWLTYQAVMDSSVPLPKTVLCKSLEQFTEAIYQLGYPQRRVCFKPPYSKGTRGFRIITAEASRLDLLLYERPDALLMTLDEVLDLFQDAKTFPELMVMEYAEGKEYTVDIFCRHGQTLMGFVKTRETIRCGLAMYFEIVERPALWQYGQMIVDCLGLDYFVNIQFKGDKLLEVNPRVSTFVHQENFNMPYLGIKYFLGEANEADLQQACQNIRPTRRTVRYFDQLFFDGPIVES